MSNERPNIPRQIDASRVVIGPDGPVSPMWDKAAWKPVRRPRLGSSDMAAILGKDEYQSPWGVWDRIVLGDWPEAEGADIRRGVRQERTARETFMERTGLEVVEVPMLALPEYPTMVTDLDGLIVRPDTLPPQILESEVWSVIKDLPGHGWLELKVPRVSTFYRYKEEGLPNSYIIQGQQHALVSGLEWGFFAFYTPEYDDIIAFPVAKDATFGPWLVKTAKRWINTYVVPEVRPIRPEPEPARWPTKILGAAAMRDDDDWMGAAALLTLRHWELTEAQEAYTQTEAQLIALLGADDTHVSGGDVTVKRRSTASQNRVDWQAFRAALLLAQRDGDTERLLALNPDDDAWKYQPKSSEKIEVKLFAPNPMEVG